MCGRFSLRIRLAELAEHFGVLEAELPPQTARYNIAPTQPVLVIRLRKAIPSPRREAAVLHWGLIPSWANDPAIGSRLINARAEDLAEKPAFRAALRHRRCLVVADGFYEWQDPGPGHGKKSKKQPFFIHFRDDRPFAFAGLWETWESPDHSAVESCTIITTAANAMLRPIHDRMPVILPPEAYSRWLVPVLQSPDVLPLLVPSDADGWESFAVGPSVNHPARDVPECIIPL